MFGLPPTLFLSSWSKHTHTPKERLRFSWQTNSSSVFAKVTKSACQKPGVTKLSFGVTSPGALSHTRHRLHDMFETRSKTCHGKPGTPFAVIERICRLETIKTLLDLPVAGGLAAETLFRFLFGSVKPSWADTPACSVRYCTCLHLFPPTCDVGMWGLAWHFAAS